MAAQRANWLHVWVIAVAWTIFQHFNWHHTGDPLSRDLLRVAFNVPLCLFIFGYVAKLMPWQQRQR